MSIHHSGTFEYAAEFSSAGFGASDIFLDGTDLSGENEQRLVGLNPRIRFWNDRLVIIASGPHKSSVRNVSFPIGDAVKLAARAGDRLYLVRTACGGMGLSLLRDEKLILATGATSRVPLGRDIQVVEDDTDFDLTNLRVDIPLEFIVQGERFTLREREVLEKRGYHIYVERCWKDGIPGTDECVSLCLADSSAIKIAAMRSAILLGNGDLKIVKWDTTESSTHL
jgi:hypothetical protein